MWIDNRRLCGMWAQTEGGWGWCTKEEGHYGPHVFYVSGPTSSQPQERAVVSHGGSQIGDLDWRLESAAEFLHAYGKIVDGKASWADAPQDVELKALVMVMDKLRVVETRLREAVEEMRRNQQTKYFYFKPSGKWKYDGVGVPIPLDGMRLTHDRIAELNGGHMPGITGDGKDYTVVVIGPSGFPRMVPAERAWT